MRTPIPNPVFLASRVLVKQVPHPRYPLGSPFFGNVALKGKELRQAPQYQSVNINPEKWPVFACFWLILRPETPLSAHLRFLFEAWE
jgi:hypothetical protein